MPNYHFYKFFSRLQRKNYNYISYMKLFKRFITLSFLVALVNSQKQGLSKLVCVFLSTYRVFWRFNFYNPIILDKQEPETLYQKRKIDWVRKQFIEHYESLSKSIFILMKLIGYRCIFVFSSVIFRYIYQNPILQKFLSTSIYPENQIISL